MPLIVHKWVFIKLFIFNYNFLIEFQISFKEGVLVGEINASRIMLKYAPGAVSTLDHNYTPQVS